MTIDEIIDEIKDIADYAEEEYGEKTFEMYMQVIDLLKELKKRRSIPEHNNDNCPNFTCRLIERKRGHDAAISGFANKLKIKCNDIVFGDSSSVAIHFMIDDAIDEVLEEMKG